MASYYQKLRLLKGLLTSDVAHAGPFYVSVDVTRRCNLRCLGCRYHSHLVNIPSPGDQTIKDISFSLFENLCDELKTMGTSSLILTGEGEPFLHPRLFDLISVAKRAGLHVLLFTNGTFLDEARVQSLIDSRLDILRVSLWASSPKEYEQNYPGAATENLKRIIDGLKQLSFSKLDKKSKTPSIDLYQPINCYNFQKIEAMVDLVRTTGCDSLSFSPFNTKDGKLTEFALSPDEEKSLRLSLSRIKKQLNLLSINHNINEILKRYRIGKSVWQLSPCYIAWLHARIKVDGMVFPCNLCDLSLGNLNENKFREIWNDGAFRTFRSRTLTRKGLVSMARHCDCGFCCHVGDNLRVHRQFKWFSPFSRLWTQLSTTTN